jgi:hypothetical protein
MQNVSNPKIWKRGEKNVRIHDSAKRSRKKTKDAELDEKAGKNAELDGNNGKTARNRDKKYSGKQYLELVVGEGAGSVIVA